MQHDTATDFLFLLLEGSYSCHWTRLSLMFVKSRVSINAPIKSSLRNHQLSNSLLPFLLYSSSTLKHYALLIAIADCSIRFSVVSHSCFIALPIAFPTRPKNKIKFGYQLGKNGYYFVRRCRQRPVYRPNHA